MKKIVLFAWGLVLSGTALAQEKIEATIGADFVSQYIWRGLDCGNVSVQPTLGVAYKGFSLSAWGSVGFKSEDTKEFDLTASYTVGGFSVGITDYCQPPGTPTSQATTDTIRAANGLTPVTWK